MNQEDRAAILDLFARLKDVEARSVPREPEAAALIDAAIAEQPGAPYYMAQTIVVQNQALREAERRIAQLESPHEQPGLLSGLFGSGRTRSPNSTAGPWNRQRFAARGDGFLASAAETALGVAGGVLLADILAGAMFGGDEAEAAESGDAADMDADTGGNFNSGDDF